MTRTTGQGEGRLRTRIGAAGPAGAGLAALLLAGCSAVDEGARRTTEDPGVVRQTLGAEARRGDTSDVAGDWMLALAAGGANCPVKLTRASVATGGTAGYFRAEHGACAAPFDRVERWTPIGSRIVLAGADGTTLAELGAAGAGKYAGQAMTTAGKLVDVVMTR